MKVDKIWKTGQDLYQNEALSLYFVIIFILLVTPIQIWSYATLKSTVIKEDQIKLNHLYLLNQKGNGDETVTKKMPFSSAF